MGTRISKTTDASQPSEVRTCDFCGGPLLPGSKDLNLRRGGRLTVVRNVPSLVCAQCGEGYVSAEISKQVDELVFGRESTLPVRKIEVSEYDASCLAG